MIGVLGATGNVGRELVDKLCARGERVRVVTRDQKRAARWAGRAECVAGDVHDAGVRARALEAVRGLFCFPFIEEPELHDAVLDAAKRAGVERIVLLSSIGATSPQRIGQLHLERELATTRSGIASTFLRPSYFMSNALRWAPAIKQEGRVVTPTPDGKTDAISPSDIAEVAALALVEPGHEGKTHVLTGADLLSVREQIAILSGVLGKPVECVGISIEAAAEGLRKAGRPEWVVESLVAMWTSVRAGARDTRTDTFATLVGRPPESFEAWCLAHRDAFL